jgi:hypothetical protein
MRDRAHLADRPPQGTARPRTRSRHGATAAHASSSSNRSCRYRLENGSEDGAVADSVHHIVPIEDGGAKRAPRS